MRKKSFSAVISAAGLSSRMGDFKPLMKLGGVPNLIRQIRVLRSCGVSPVIIVTGYRAAEIGREVREAFPGEMDSSLILVHNPEYANTQMLDSVRLGLAEVGEKTEGILIVPVDIPLFSAFTVKKLQETFREDEEHSLFIPRFEGVSAHPLLLHREQIPSLLSWCGDEGLRGFCRDSESLTAFVDTPDRGSALDADTREEYQILEAEWEDRMAPSEETCRRLWQYAGTSEWVQNHCLATARLARYIARCCKTYCREKQIPLSPEKVYAAGLLHDILKACPDHAEAGAAFLEDLGYTEVAPLVRTHMDLPEEYLTECNENLILYLADKMTEGSQYESIESRFSRKEETFRKDPEALKSLQRRKRNALQAADIAEKAGFHIQNH